MVSLKNFVFIVALILVVALAIPVQASRMGLFADKVESTVVVQADSDTPSTFGDLESRERLTTPDLIEADLIAGVIDQEMANLYLAYALSNNPHLPVQYHSTMPWHGTLAMLHLQQ